MSSLEYQFTFAVTFISSFLSTCPSLYLAYVWDAHNLQRRWQQECLKSRNCYNIELFFRVRLLTARFELQYYAWFFVDWPGVNKVKIWPIHTVLWYREDCMTTVTATIPLWNFVGESWYCNSPLILSSDTRLGFDFDFWHSRQESKLTMWAAHLPLRNWYVQMQNTNMCFVWSRSGKHRIFVWFLNDASTRHYNNAAVMHARFYLGKSYFRSSLWMCDHDGPICCRCNSQKDDRRMERMPNCMKSEGQDAPIGD